MNDRAGARQVQSELMRMFVYASDMPYPAWARRMGEDAVFAGFARRLVWQADGRCFLPEGGACSGTDGTAFAPDGPVSLAHPVELDAGEILYWRDRLASVGVKQPFRQMWEPVVLRDGSLAGTAAQIVSAGETYEMNGRYGGYTLPLNSVTALKREDWRFIVRSRWDERRRHNAEIEVVNAVTPAGILYECAPDRPMEKLTSRRDAGLRLKLFYPFGGARMRTLNHTAALLEGYLLDQFAARGDAELLLPHLPGMDAGRLAQLRALCPHGCGPAGILDELLARDGAPC